MLDDGRPETALMDPVVVSEAIVVVVIRPVPDGHWIMSVRIREFLSRARREEDEKAERTHGTRAFFGDRATPPADKKTVSG
jgi:hypothetical protein